MNKSSVALLILLLLAIDQAIKIYVKTHFYYGEEYYVFGLDWFRLHFLENPGMAWGFKFGEGYLDKFVLILFRLVAVIWGTFYIKKMIRKGYAKVFIICAAFIYAGALGNLIDGAFYGLIFEKSDPALRNIAEIFPSGAGYAGFLNGNVVDMWWICGSFLLLIQGFRNGCHYGEVMNLLFSTLYSIPQMFGLAQELFYS